MAVKYEVPNFLLFCIFWLKLLGFIYKTETYLFSSHHLLVGNNIYWLDLGILFQCKIYVHFSCNQQKENSTL